MKRLTFRQRRAMGVTFRSIRAAMRELDLEGLSMTEVFDLVMDKLIDDNPKGWEDPKIDWDNINWDALFAFIERIIALIIRLFL